MAGESRTSGARGVLPSFATQRLLERISATIERSPDLDARTIRVRSRVARRNVDLAIGWLQERGYVDRRRADGEWHYRSVSPFRAQRETGREKHYR